MSLSLNEQYDKIYKYCYFKVKNTQLAEDITQETFLKFFDRHAYISQGKPLAYLYTIARNLCVDTYRKKVTQPLPDDAEDTVSSINAIETTITIRQAVKALPQDWQEILLLRYANDLSMAEICLITGVSRFSLRRTITKALQQLKQSLREEDFQ